jgi:hypothetical protein
MLVTGPVEIEAPIVVLLTVTRIGVPIMTLNGNPGLGEYDVGKNSFNFSCFVVWFS